MSKIPRPVIDEVVASTATRIRTVRGQRVLLDEDLARLYGVPTKRLNEAVTRNSPRFPDDFMFRLTSNEARSLKSQFATSKAGRGGRRRSSPRAFTEQGVAMLSSVLRSPRAIGANIEIMRAFVRLRRASGEYAELVQRLADLEERYGRSLRAVFDAISALQQPPKTTPRRPIGFRPPGR